MENKLSVSVKNLTIVNLNELYQKAISDFSIFVRGMNYTKKDAEKLIAHFFFSSILEIYSLKNNYGFLLFYQEELTSEKQKIPTNFLRYFKTKIKIPMMITNFSFETYIDILSKNSPEYDEAISQNFSLSDKINLLKIYMKKQGLEALYKKVSEETTKVLGFK